MDGGGAEPSGQPCVDRSATPCGSSLAPPLGTELAAGAVPPCPKAAQRQIRLIRSQGQKHWELAQSASRANQQWVEKRKNAFEHAELPGACHKRTNCVEIV